MKKLQLIGGFVWVWCMMIALPAAAQTTLKGHVVNAQTKNPVEGANVVYATNQGAITDINGDFRIPCEEPVRIKVSHIGYRTYQETIRNCENVLNIMLRPLAYRLQKITVEDRVEIERAESVSTLSLADLNKQTGLRLKDALNTVPGVEMQTRSPFGGQRITIRGYYPNAGNSTNFNGLGYQLYLNNIPVTDATGTTIMDDIDFATLGAVEVIKGPSPLYGNEIAGVVNLYSARPQKDGTALSEKLVAGSYGLLGSNTSLATRSGDFDLKLNYGRQSYDSFRPQDESRKDYVSVAGHYKISDSDMISAYFSYNSSDEELAGGLVADDFYARRAIASPNYVANDGGVVIESFRSGVTSHHNFNSKFWNKTTLFATGHTLDQKFAHGFNYHENLNFGARTNFMYQQQFENVGVEGQLGAFVQKSKESVDGVFIPPFVAPPFTPDTEPQFPTNDQNYALNYNVFTKWAFELPKDFKISLGGVLNFNRFGIRDMLNNGALYSGSSTRSNRFDPTFSPSASVLKSFGGHTSIYASVSTGSTPPLLGDIIASDGSVNDGLEPEHAVQYEVGMKGNRANGRLSYRLALFDMEISNRLAAQFSDGVSYTTNVGKQQNRGLELALDYDFIRAPEQPISLLNLSVNYTYSDFAYEDFEVFAQNTAGNDSTTADFSGNEVAGVAPHMLNLGLDIKSSFGLYLNTRYKYMDEAPVTFDNEEYIRSYNLLSARLGFKKTLSEHVNLDVFAGSNNITGSTYYNFLFVGQNIGGLGDGYISPAPYKATIYGGLNFSYNF